MAHTTKKCTKCELALPVDAFSKRTDTSGRQARCRPCVAAYARERYRARISAGAQNESGWYAKNRDRARATTAAWKKAHPDRKREYAARRRASMKTASPVAQESVSARLRYFGHRCWMCGLPATTIDHVKPLSKGGPHIASNLRPACFDCNTRKGARWPGVAQLDLFRR